VKVYNTMSRRKDELLPLKAGEVRMYVCGVTVYDFSHIGHARSALVFDVLRRYLRFKGYRVTFVPISTVYTTTVPSHFRPLRDSARIVSTLWRFGVGGHR